jgi:hypothetical protein
MRRAMLMVLLVAVISACGPHLIVAQAGQSGPPFYLWVLFRPHTTKSVAAKVLSDCRRQPDVIRIGQLVTTNGALRGTVWTKDGFRSARTQPLLNCLHAAGSVQEAAWPG